MVLVQRLGLTEQRKRSYVQVGTASSAEADGKFVGFTGCLGRMWCMGGSIGLVGLIGF